MNNKTQILVVKYYLWFILLFCLSILALCLMIILGIAIPVNQEESNKELIIVFPFMILVSSLIYFIIWYLNKRLEYFKKYDEFMSLKTKTFGDNIEY